MTFCELLTDCGCYLDHLSSYPPPRTPFQVRKGRDPLIPGTKGDQIASVIVAMGHARASVGGCVRVRVRVKVRAWKVVFP